MDISGLFPTLISKTFLILGLTLILTYIGSLLIISFFRRALRNNKPYVKAKKIKHALYPDIVVDSKFIGRIFWPFLIINILSFIAMLFLRENLTLSLLLVAVFTFTEGIILGVVLINLDENLALKVTGLTVMATLGTSVIGMYSGIDFNFLGEFLFWALLGLIGVNIFRLFRGINGTRRKIFAVIGILIFIGYLLYDFNRLKKLSSLGEYNNWLTAQDMAINIYLDIINLFLYILDLLSD